MKYSFKKIFLSAILALIASLGTAPYGFKFATILLSAYSLLYIPLAYFLAITSAFANMALGSYSLMSADAESVKQYPPLIIVSLLGAIPTGFMCFFAYQNSLPLSVNVFMSIIVALVNAGIGFTATKNLYIFVKEKVKLDSANNNFSMPTSEIIFRWVGAFIGFVVSSLSYMAAAHGLVNVLMYYQLKSALAESLGYLFAVFAWLPMAALFAYSTQSVAGDLAQFFKRFNKSIRTVSIYTVLIFLLALASGSAYAQMALDFFDPNHYIPEIFKENFIQTLIFPVLMPMAFVSSAAVNCFALQNVLAMLKR